MSAIRGRPDLETAVYAALDKVVDPEIRQPITKLGMVDSVAVGPDGDVTVTVRLTVAGCPMRERITQDVRDTVGALPGVGQVSVELAVMTADQRTGLRRQLQGDSEEAPIVFASPESRTRVYCVASGKGGVGKSTLTANLAAALAAQGQRVGVIDADIYGQSIPRALGVEARPTQVDRMLMPPEGHGVKLISMGMFTEGNAPVLWRGPMLHRALRQFFADVYWGELDVLLIDLPPGTGDISISLAQMVPDAEILVVTTPQAAASEVAERAGTAALQTKQRVIGVIENMAWAQLPGGERWEPFGSGGGAAVASSLTAQLGYDVAVVGRLPLEASVREGGDEGVPAVIRDPEGLAAVGIREIADWLASRSRGLPGRRLPLAVI